MDDATRPLYAQTQAVLSALDRGSAVALAPLVTADVSLVDSADGGRPTVLHTREALEAYLRSRGDGPASSAILAYEGRPDHETGWSVVRFQRSSRAPGRESRRELCSATLLWRLTDEGWKLSRWHCTVEKREAASP